MCGPQPCLKQTASFDGMRPQEISFWAHNVWLKYACLHLMFAYEAVVSSF